MTEKSLKLLDMQNHQMCVMKQEAHNVHDLLFSPQQVLVENVLEKINKFNFLTEHIWPDHQYQHNSQRLESIHTHFSTTCRRGSSGRVLPLCDDLEPSWFISGTLFNSCFHLELSLYLLSSDNQAVVISFTLCCVTATVHQHFAPRSI